MQSGAILAGGRARRFGGRDKSRLIFGGRSIRERQIQELSELSDDILIVGGVDRPLQSTIACGGGHADVREIPDRLPDHGPLGGLEAALAAARHDLVVALAGDMPFVRASFLMYLVSLAGQSDAVVPVTGGEYHPLCAVYARTCLDLIRTELSAGRLSMKGFLNLVKVRAVREDEIETFGKASDLLANVNTPADFADAAMAEHQP